VSKNVPPEDELDKLEDEELRRLSLQIRAKQEQAEKEAQGSEVSAAGENEMTTPRIANPGAPGGNPQQGITPAEHKKDIEKTQNDTFTAAIENEVAVSKKDSQKQKVRVARANATQSRARADVAEVRARAAEESRDSNIADILSKLDSNIDGLAVTGNPEIRKVFVQLESTIDSIEKQNPFAMLGANLSREFKIMGKPSKKKKGKAVPSQTKSEIPEEAEKVQPMPESPTGTYDPHGATGTPPPSPTRQKFSGSRYEKSGLNKLFGRKKKEAPPMAPKEAARTQRESFEQETDADAASIMRDAKKAAGLVKTLDGHINNL